MRKRRLLKEFDQLLLTNRVDWESPCFQSILLHLTHGLSVPAIITVRIEGSSGRHVIVDGNHRAVAHACLKRPIRYFEIRSDADIDTILHVEARGGFADFPHRAFLTQRFSYDKLVHDAVVASSQVMKTCTAYDRAQEFAHRLNAS